MKNLVVNGCSFTQKAPGCKTWATFVNETLSPERYYNIAQSGAGNQYICDSTIEFLESTQFDPLDTTVVIMWSGIGRKDLHIGGSWHYHFKDFYGVTCKRNDETYFLHSGGLTDSWLSNKEIRKIFEPIYKIADPLSLCKENLLLFIKLKSYLVSKGYKFIFTNYFNTWNPDVESTHGGDYCIAYFCKQFPIYNNFDFANWKFANANRDCLGDLAHERNGLDDTWHPTVQMHEQFSKTVIQWIEETPTTII